MIKRILFQGDSITDVGREKNSPTLGPQLGYGYPQLIAARLLADRMDDDLEVVNRGISGNRVVDLYARWKIDALNLTPDIISILIGVNDTWHEFERDNGVEIDRYEQIYRMLLSWTRATLPQVKLVLMEPFCLDGGPVTVCWKYEIAQRSAIVRKLAGEFDAVYVPLQSMLDEAAARTGNPTRILRDGVHPELVGHQLIADQWLKFAGELFA